MTLSHRARLQQTQTFPQLIRFLRDEMGWPIESEDFEDLTFTYTPEELGIESGSAAKIAEIQRLRPLVLDQPWGIFFVRFEPKRLPVVALRRILSAFVMHRRVSADSADRMTWETDDLLFISNYGEDEDRQLSFAHFSASAEGSGLPTLKVLGWDNRDTALHLDRVAKELTEKLAWPHDETDLAGWRETWSSAFTLGHREVVTTSKALAVRLAALARVIRDRIKTLLAIEIDQGPLTRLMKAFRESLVHDLEPDDFADMYAQTIAYGLLSARIADPKSKTTDDFGAHMRTNPLLRDLMSTFLDVGGYNWSSNQGMDFDELGVSEVVELLDDANMEAVLRDFGDRNPQDDPVIHFYELFLTEYDPKRRLQRGVFYTPRPVASYIVRSVDELLRSEFGLADGLADITTWGEMAERHEGLAIPKGVDSTAPFVTILDLATGTGTFLVETIDVVHRTLVEKWKREGNSESEILDLWNDYVPKHLLPRLYGFELLIAPYAIAHLKIGLKLHETGYRFAGEGRAHVYLTNALEPPSDFSGQLDFAVPALAREADAVNEVKRSRRFTIVLGNPPYSGHSWNLTPELRKIVDRYRYVDSERIRERGALQLEKNLQDDYVKFVCLAETHIQSAGAGIAGMITSHGFLDNVFLRGMRWSLLETYDDVFVLDLHGNVLRGDKALDGGQDQNVFDIKQTGAAISILSRTRRQNPGVVRHADLWGSRDVKFSFLTVHTASSTSTSELHPTPPLNLFVPRDARLQEEYEAGDSMTDVMPLRSLALVTGRDAFVLDHNEHELLERMREFAAARGSDADIDEQFGLRSSTWWSSSAATLEMPEPSLFGKFVRTVLYRPFDRRFCFYHPSVVESLRRPVMQNLDPGRENLLLITTRMTKGEPFGHVLVSDGLAEAILLSSKTSNSAYVFPMYVYHCDDETLITLERQGNFAPAFRSRFASLLAEEPSSEDLFHYIYAFLHSPTYRSRYIQFLRTDFPRILCPRSTELFVSLAAIGRSLVATHLLRHPATKVETTRFVGPENPVATRVGWSDDVVWLDAASLKRDQPVEPGTMGFHGIPEAVWNCRIGGYRVCEKWLKDRKGRVLSGDDIAHYQKIVVALSETMRLMQETDEVIEEHGGWPGAFAAEES